VNASSQGVDPAEDALGDRFVMAAAILSGVFWRSAGRALNLRKSEYLVLRLLYEDPARSATYLAAHIGVSKPRMSFLVDGLGRRGLLERHRDLRDRRQQRLQLTAAGQALSTEAGKLFRNGETPLSSRLSAAERRVLIDLLEAMTLSTGKARAPAQHPN
jgi:DNA-binding MarR family transcriptional regulator